MDRFFSQEEYSRDAHESLLELVRGGHATAVNRLLTKMKEEGTPCDLTIASSGGYSLIGIAAEYNMLSMVKVLLQHGAPHDQLNRISAIPPIISARAHRNEEMIRILENPEAFLSEGRPNRPTHSG